MDSAGRERELGPHRPPVGQVGRCVDGVGLPQRNGTRSQPGPRQQRPPRELSHPDAASHALRQLWPPTAEAAPRR